jgi:S1-C subfamily serine protease
MRLRSLAPLLVLSALGCHPRDVGEAPATSSSVETGEDQHASQKPQPERPPGTIYRSELVRATRGGNAPYLLGQLGPEAYSPQGRFEGWIITRVWPGDPELCAPGCDLRAGDIILSVNNSKLETPEQLTNLLGELDALESIEVAGIRDGEFFERIFPILPDPALPL